MLKYILAIAVLICSLSFSTKAQTPLLQALIDATPAGGTLTLPSDVVYPCQCVISKSITIEGNGAKVVTSNADPAITILPNTDNVTLRNLDLSATGFVHDIVRIGDQGAAQDTLEEAPANITLDRVSIHGAPGQDSQRGVAANGANITITNSRIYEIHGRGFDTQAICSWNGPGPFKIVNNYLEASGENVMFGGSLPTIPNLVHSDIEFRGNHVFKPLSWYVNDPSYAGIRWSVKNLFELKNARRVVIEGNVFENNWTDAQAGRAIVFTPRPSDSGPAAVVEDVEFCNNIVKNVGSGVLLLGHDEPPAPTDTRLRRVRLSNNLFENVNGPRFGSNGAFLTVIARTEDVTVEHNTAIQTGHIVIADYEPNVRFTYRDNIARHNEYGIFGSGLSPGNPTIAYYFPDSIITSNLIAKEVNSPWNTDLIYPSGNYFPENLNGVGFVDLAAANYRLASWSPYKGIGTNGTDPGCDVDALNAALNGSGSPLPTPTPTPVPSPSPSPSAEATPIPAPSSDGTKGETITDNQGGVWTLGPRQETFRNSVHMSAGYGSVYKWLNSSVYVRGMDSNWYQWGSTGWASVGPAEPGTPDPSPTPTPSPSPTPAPSPSPTPLPSPTPAPTPRCSRTNPKGKCIKWI